MFTSVRKFANVVFDEFYEFQRFRSRQIESQYAK